MGRISGLRRFLKLPVRRRSVLADVDEDAVRNKILRMLEGHLITFGPAIMFDEVLEDEDE